MHTALDATIHRDHRQSMIFTTKFNSIRRFRRQNNLEVIINWFILYNLYIGLIVSELLFIYYNNIVLPYDGVYAVR